MARAASLPDAAQPLLPASLQRKQQQQPKRQRSETLPPVAAAAERGQDGTQGHAVPAAVPHAAAAATGLPPSSQPVRGGAAGSSQPGPKATAAAATPQPPRRSASPPAAPAVAGGGLAHLASLLPAVLEGTGSGGTGGTGAGPTVQELQKEGKTLKKFAEKRMKDGKPTHVSSMFLCQVRRGRQVSPRRALVSPAVNQWLWSTPGAAVGFSVFVFHVPQLGSCPALQSCVKFLEVAAAMEANPPKFSRERYTQQLPSPPRL
jgi:hypothetical protein